MRAKLILMVLWNAILLSRCSFDDSEKMNLHMIYHYENNIYEEYFGDQYKSMQNTDLDTFFHASNYSIKHEEVEVDDESISVINIYNENEELIYQNNDDLNYVHRVYIFDDEKIYIWLSAWGNTNFYVGPLNEGIYIDGYLGNGMLLAVDTNTGDELYKLKTDKNEIFLTVNDNKAYFYHQGYTENQGMLWWEEDKNAKIFYRDLDDFNTKHIVHTFGYDASMYNESINVEEIVGLDLRFLEQGTFVTEKLNDNLEFNISEDNISIKFNYSLIAESVGIDYTLPLWEVNIPFADNLEVTSENNDLTIKYDDEIVQSTDYIHSFGEFSMKIDKKLQFYEPLTAFISENITDEFYYIRSVNDFKPQRLEESSENPLAIFDNFMWISGKEYSENTLYYNGHECLSDSQFSESFLKQGITNSGIEYYYNFATETAIYYDDETHTYDERVVDKGIIGYVYFGEHYPVEIIEVSCFYDSDVMSDEEIVLELEEMIKSIKFN